jgi:hypothetical protein
MLALVRRLGRSCLRPIKARLRPVVSRLVRRLSVQFAADIVPMKSLEARQSRLEAYRWDHAAMVRRLAALEDHVEELLRQQASTGPSQDEATPAIVPLAPTDSVRSSGTAGESARLPANPRRQRVA